MDLARAPRRAARKKGSGYENESTVALCTVYQDVMGSVLAIFGDPGLETNPKSLCYVWVYVHLWTVTVIELTVFSYEVTVQ
jgi:hypothetical protein